MKKVVLFVIVLTITSAIISVKGQTSSISFGDKSSKEIKSSVKLFQSQIKEYNKNITKLTKERNLFDVRFTRDSTSVGKMRYLREMKRCDSILAVYREKIGNNEEQIENLLATAAGKDQTDRTDLKVRRSGQNIGKLADAYLTISYANKLASQPANVKPLKGLVVNNWYRDVKVIITGPANFKWEGYLKGGSKQEFDVPFPGWYVTTFTCTKGSSSTRKQVSLNNNYYDGNTRYDYRADLFKN